MSSVTVRSPSGLCMVTVLFLRGDRFLTVSSAACCLASKTCLALDHCSKQTSFLSLPSGNKSKLRRIRGPWVAHNSSPRQLKSASSIGSLGRLQESDCHCERIRSRYPDLAEGCMARTAGDPRHLSMWSGIHCCHFSAMVATCGTNFFFTKRRPAAQFDTLIAPLAPTNQGHSALPLRVASPHILSCPKPTKTISPKTIALFPEGSSGPTGVGPLNGFWGTRCR